MNEVGALLLVAKEPERADVSTLHAPGRLGWQLSDTVRGAFAGLGRDEGGGTQRGAQRQGRQPLHRRPLCRQERRQRRRWTVGRRKYKQSLAHGFL